MSMCVFALDVIMIFTGPTDISLSIDFHISHNLT